MKNHYTALVHNGFLSNAAIELDVAQTYFRGTRDTFDTNPMDHGFMWYFSKEQKKACFNDIYDDLDVGSYVYDAYDAGAKDEDVIVLSSPDFLILCAKKKSIVQEAATEHYTYEGILPYHTTKKKIKGEIHWFVFSWLAIPFSIPNFN